MNEAPMSELSVVDHLGITVANIEASVKWYQTSFNCVVLYQDKREAMLQFDNVKLSLTLPSYHPAHIAFQKADAATYGELREQADGSRSTLVGDPTGNMVELLVSANK